MRLLKATEIAELCAKGIIIRERFQRSHCDGMAYGLTLGTRVQSITRTELNYREIDKILILGPGESVNVEINERFNFNDEYGRPAYIGIILAGARLLAGGILHPATFVDPGAAHATTLTLINLRNFPSRSFRPGSDVIAKMIVFELDESEIPPVGWEATPPYVTLGRDHLPVLWADVHLLKEWAPTVTASVGDLEEVRTSWGPPFDVLSVGLAQLAERVRVIEAEQAGHKATKQHGRLAKIESVRFWVTVAVAFVSAIVGAIAGVWIPDGFLGR